MTASERDVDPGGDGGSGAAGVDPLRPGHVRVVSAVSTSVAPDDDAPDGVADPALIELVDETPDGRLVIDDHGLILQVNTALETLFGYHRTELLGQRVEVLIPERSRAAHVISRGLFGAKPSVRSLGLGLQLLGRHHDGSEIAVDIRLRPLPTTTGSWVVADVRDDTQRRASERHRQVDLLSDEDLRISRALGETVIHSMFGIGLRMHSLLPRAGKNIGEELSEVIDALDEVIHEIRTVIFALAAAPPDTEPAGD